MTQRSFGGTIGSDEAAVVPVTVFMGVVAGLTFLFAQIPL